MLPVKAATASIKARNWIGGTELTCLWNKQVRADRHHPSAPSLWDRRERNTLFRPQLTALAAKQPTGQAPSPPMRAWQLTPNGRIISWEVQTCCYQIDSHPPESLYCTETSKVYIIICRGQSDPNLLASHIPNGLLG
jgi:hypothetical protein